jgi:hypothetical protein
MAGQTFTVLIAGVALLFSLYTTFGNQRIGRIRDWQRVAVHGAIEDLIGRGEGPASIDRIQAEYLRQAQQLSQWRLPRREIQTHQLKRILLDLQRDGVITRDKDQRYHLQVISALDAYTADSVMSLIRQRDLRLKILRLVDAQTGISRESLVRILQEAGYGASFDEIDTVLFELMNVGVRLNERRELVLTQAKGSATSSP